LLRVDELILHDNEKRKVFTENELLGKLQEQTTAEIGAQSEPYF